MSLSKSALSPTASSQFRTTVVRNPLNDDTDTDDEGGGDLRSRVLELDESVNPLNEDTDTDDEGGGDLRSRVLELEQEVENLNEIGCSAASLALMKLTVPYIKANKNNQSLNTIIDNCHHKKTVRRLKESEAGTKLQDTGKRLTEAATLIALADGGVGATVAATGASINALAQVRTRSSGKSKGKGKGKGKGKASGGGRHMKTKHKKYKKSRKRKKKNTKRRKNISRTRKI